MPIHATSQPARFTSHDVAQARYAIASALILIGAEFPTATRMQALRVLLLAHAAFNAARQPATQRIAAQQPAAQHPPAQQIPSAASHKPVQTPASSRQSDASAGTEKNRPEHVIQRRLRVAAQNHNLIPPVRGPSPPASVSRHTSQNARELKSQARFRRSLILSRVHSKNWVCQPPQLSMRSRERIERLH